MVTSALMLLLSGIFFSLRLGPGNGSFPQPLSSVEEQQAIQAWVERQDMDARNLLVEHNLRLVAHIVKKYYAQNADPDDLISIGTIGLIKGVSTYRPDKKVKLATYASRCIENEILMFFRSQKKNAGNISLSEHIDGDGDGDNLSLIDVLTEDRDLLDDIVTMELCRQLRRNIDETLSPREAEVIRLRYGLDGMKPLTQREVAEKGGISRSYVSRIEKKALQRLREVMDG